MRADGSRFRIVQRRTLLALGFCLGIVALALPTTLYFYLDRFRARLAIAGQLDGSGTRALEWLIYANAALFLIPGAFLFWYASRVLHAGTFPPPGTWALEGQQIQLGSRASLRAFIVFAVAACCIAIGTAWIALALTIGRLGQP